MTVELLVPFEGTCLFHINKDRVNIEGESDVTLGIPTTVGIPSVLKQHSKLKR